MPTSLVGAARAVAPAPGRDWLFRVNCYDWVTVFARFHLRMQIRLTVYFSGHVQGVGFRYRTAEAAAGRAVSGFVENLFDGRVLLVCEGEREACNDFVAAVAARLGQYIAEQHATESDPTGQFADFHIRH